MCSAQKNQDGIILVIVMFMLAALTSLSLVGSHGAQTELRIALNDALAARALAVAEAGIDHATDLLAAGVTNGFTDELNGGNGTGGSLAGLGSITTLADGNLYRFHAFGGTASDGYYVRIADNFDERTGANDATTDLDSRITIIAIGQVGRAQRVIEAGVGAGPSLFDVAVFGEEGVSLDSNACTDSYDSTQGAYGPWWCASPPPKPVLSRFPVSRRADAWAPNFDPTVDAAASVVCAAPDPSWTSVSVTIAAPGPSVCTSAPMCWRPPDRAAYSHSASAGSRFPAHSAYAFASCQVTQTTG